MTTKLTSRRSHRTLAVACGAAFAVGMPASAALAAEPVLDNTHFHLTFAHVEQDIGFCMDVPFPIRHNGSTNVLIQSRTHGTSGPTYDTLRYNTDDVYTNVDTEESFTTREVVRQADTKVTENADGTITIAYSSQMTVTVHTPSGALLGVDSRRVTGSVRIDLADPQNPDDDVVIFEQHSDPVGVSQLGGFDLCSVAEKLLG